MGSHRGSLILPANKTHRGRVRTSYEHSRVINCRGCGTMIVFAQNIATGKWVPLSLETRAVHKCVEYRPDMAVGHRPEIYLDRKRDAIQGITIRKQPTPDQKRVLDERKSGFATQIRQAAPADPQPATEDETPTEGV